MDVNKTEVKEITMEQLKTLMVDGLKEMLPQFKSEIVTEVGSKMLEKREETKEEKMEKAAKFIKDLVERKLDTPVSSTTGSLGYTIPTELAAAILEKKLKIAKMRKLAFVFQMAGPFQLPLQGDGVTAYWVTENTEITTSAPTTTKKDLGDYYLAARILMPRKLLNTSAFNIVEYVSSLASRYLVSTEETSFVAGSGSGQPTGFRGMTGQKIWAQAGSSLAYDDMVTTYYSLPEQYRALGVWFTSPEGVMAIRKIKDTYGLPIFNVNDSTVFGRPLIESVDIPANLQTSANCTEIWFFDPTYYWIKDGEAMFALVQEWIKTLQTEVVIAEAIDGVYTLPEAAVQLQAVKA